MVNTNNQEQIEINGRGSGYWEDVTKQGSHQSHLIISLLNEKDRTQYSSTKKAISKHSAL